MIWNCGPCKASLGFNAGMLRMDDIVINEDGFVKWPWGPPACPYCSKSMTADKS